MSPMQLPFTVEQFYGVFSAYNMAIWPAQIFLPGLALIAIALLAAQRRFSGVGISGVLAFLWAWQALAYHLAFFTAINPLAYVFAAVFFAGAIVFFWQGVVRRKLDFEGAPWRAQMGRSEPYCVFTRRIPGMVLLRWPPLPGFSHFWTAVPHHAIYHWSACISGQAISAQPLRSPRSMVPCRQPGRVFVECSRGFRACRGRCCWPGTACAVKGRGVRPGPGLVKHSPTRLLAFFSWVSGGQSPS